MELLCVCCCFFFASLHLFTSLYSHLGVCIFLFYVGYLPGSRLIFFHRRALFNQQFRRSIVMFVVCLSALHIRMYLMHFYIVVNTKWTNHAVNVTRTYTKYHIYLFGKHVNNICNVGTWLNNNASRRQCELSILFEWLLADVAFPLFIVLIYFI